MKSKPFGYKNTSSSSAYVKSSEELRNIVYDYIPEKSIVNDLKNVIEKNNSKDYSPYTHNFSNISEGRILHPNGMIEYEYYNLSKSNPEINLYGGGFGMGCYHNVMYNIQDSKYIYYVGESKSMQPIFSTDSWTELHKYVSNYCEELIKWSKYI